MSPPHPPRVAADEEIKLNDRFPNSIREPLEHRARLNEIRDVWPPQAIARFWTSVPQLFPVLTLSWWSFCLSSEFESGSKGHHWLLG